MDNNKDYQIYKSEQQESFNDVNGNHINVKRTEEAVNNSDSYKDGYVNAQENLAARDNNNAARGLVIGLLLTTLVGLTAGVIYFLNQRNDTPSPATPAVVVPQKSEAKPSPEKQTTIIERTRDVIVPVPQQQAKPQPTTPAPRQNINISIPNPVSKPPAEQKAPSTSQTSQQSNQSDRTPTQSTKSDTTTSTPVPENSSTPVPEKSSQTDIKSETNSDNSGASNTSNSSQ